MRLSLVVIAMALLALVVAPEAIDAVGSPWEGHSAPAFRNQDETNGTPVAASDESIPPKVDWFLANCGWGSGGPAAQIGVSLGSAATSSYGASGPRTTDDVYTLDLSAYSAGDQVALESIFFYDAQGNQIGDAHPTGTVTVNDCSEDEFSYSVGGTLYDNGNCSSVRIDPEVTTNDLDSILYVEIWLPANEIIVLDPRALTYNEQGSAFFWLTLFKISGDEPDPAVDLIVAYGETNELTRPDSCEQTPTIPDFQPSLAFAGQGCQGVQYEIGPNPWPESAFYTIKQANMDRVEGANGNTLFLSWDNTDQVSGTLEVFENADDDSPVILSLGSYVKDIEGCDPAFEWTVSIYMTVLGGDPIGQEYCFTVTVTARASYTEYQGVCLTYPGSVTIPVVKGSGVQVTEVVPDGSNFVSVMSTLPGSPGNSPASWWVGLQAISENNGFVDFNFANELDGKETPTPIPPKSSHPAVGPGSPEQPGAVSTLPQTGTGGPTVLAQALLVIPALLALGALGAALRLRTADRTAGSRPGCCS